MFDQVSLDLEREPLSEADLALYCGRYCHVASYQTLLAAITDATSVVLTGSEGVGKGALIRRLQQESPPGVRFLECRVSPSNLVDLLGFLCDRLGLKVGEGGQTQQQVLAEYLQQCRVQGSRLVLILQQAEQLESRLLADLLELFALRPEALPQLLISGTASLAERLLWVHSLDIPALIHCRVTRLNDVETRELLRWGLSYLGVDPERLDSAALDCLVKQAQGLPGRAVTLCEYTSSLAELDAGGEITAAMLEGASGELELADDSEGINLRLDELLSESGLEDAGAHAIDDPAESAPEATAPPMIIDLQSGEDPRDLPRSGVTNAGPRARLFLLGSRPKQMAAASATVLLAALAAYGIYHKVLSPRLPPAEPAHLVQEPLRVSPIPAVPVELAVPLAPNAVVGRPMSVGADSSEAVALPATEVNDAVSPTVSPVTVAVDVSPSAVGTDAPPLLDATSQPFFDNLLAATDVDPRTLWTVRAPDEVAESAITEEAPLASPQPSSTPVSTPAPSISTAAAAESPDGFSPRRLATVTELRAGGDRQLARHDPAAARLFYESAALAGDPAAAMAVAMTYDPVHLAAQGLRWSHVDPDLATEWYLYAIQQGEAEAETRLSALSDWLMAQPLPTRQRMDLPAETPLADFQLKVAVPERRDYLQTGDRWLLRSDPVAARLLYLAAAEAGSAIATVAVAMTYDPVELDSRGFAGGHADPARALAWYRRARDLGAVGVEARIERLVRGQAASPGLAGRQP